MRQAAKWGWASYGILAAGLLIPFESYAVPARIALLHSNPALRQVEENITQLEMLVEEAFQNGSSIIVAPELATTGYCLTREQVVDELGLTEPYPELANIRDLAMQYQGYVFLGIAEITPAGAVLNSAVAYGPNGYLRTQAKRSLPLWHDRGTTPIEPITTPYGDVAVLVCSDSYLPDMARIATVRGADVLVVPANWWGRNDQEQVWQVRAQENGVWFLVANRWGEEIDDRFSPPYTYNMNDAPSVVIDPNGKMLQIHRAEDDSEPQTTILYQDIDVPAYRVGNQWTPTYSVNKREPSAYGELANLYYRRDLGHVEYPGLPPAGVVRVASMAYRPSQSNSLATIRRIWSKSDQTAEVLVLPGLGITMQPVSTSNPNWYAAAPWSDLQSFVEANGLSLLVSSVLTRDLAESLLIVTPGQAPTLVRQIHDSALAEGSGIEPVTIDLAHTRVGVLLGRDALFPEASTHLAKSGADLLVVTSTVGTDARGAPFLGINYHSDQATLQRLWRVRSNESFHVAASDWIGTGIVVENGGGFINQVLDASISSPLATMDLDSALVRFKYLNAYESHDLDALLGE